MISFGRSDRASDLQLLVIQQPVLAPHTVLNRPEPFAGLVRRRAMRQMAAGRQRHA